MGRTRLKSIEIAGIRIAVELAGGASWRWAERTHAPFESPSTEPDLYVGVRYELPRWDTDDAVRYSSRGRSFEVGRCRDNGSDWIVKVHGPHGSERIARFDERFTQGEVGLHPSAAAAGVAPFDQPLDELVFLHAAAQRRIMIVDGTLRAGEHGTTLELFEAGHGPVLPGTLTDELRDRVETGRIALSLTPTGVRAHGTPWGTAALGASGGSLSAIHHVLDSPGGHTRALTCDAGFQVLMDHVVAPVHAPNIADALLETADLVATRLPVIQIAVAPPPVVRSLDWDSPMATRALSAPRLA